MFNVSMRWLWTLFECTFLSTRPPQQPLRAWRSAFVLRQICMESSQESFGSHCLGHAKAKTPQLRANLSRRTGWAAGSTLRRIPGWVVSRGGWRCPGHNEWLLLLPLPFCQAQWLLLVPWRTGTAHVILSLMFLLKIQWRYHDVVIVQLDLTQCAWTFVTFVTQAGRSCTLPSAAATKSALSS